MLPLTRESCKAARALVNWTAAKLGEAAGVPVDTIRSFESSRTRTLNRENEFAIRKAFEVEGIQFLEAGAIARGSGVSRSVGLSTTD